MHVVEICTNSSKPETTCLSYPLLHYILYQHDFSHWTWQIPKPLSKSIWLHSEDTWCSSWQELPSYHSNERKGARRLVDRRRQTKTGSFENLHRSHSSSVARPNFTSSNLSETCRSITVSGTYWTANENNHPHRRRIESDCLPDSSKFDYRVCRVEGGDNKHLSKLPNKGYPGAYFKIFLRLSLGHFSNSSGIRGSLLAPATVCLEVDCSNGEEEFHESEAT